MQSEHTDKLVSGLVEAQKVMKPAKFNAENSYFKRNDKPTKYANLVAVLEAVQKPLIDNGIAITQTTEMRQGGFVLVTTLRHTSGQWIASEYPLPQVAKPQELASAITYARRYSLSGIACIAADEDDDANAANQSGQVAEMLKRNGKNGAHIEPVQVDNLRAMIAEVGADEEKFCRYLKVGALSELPASRWDDAVSALEAKGARQ